MTPPPLGSLSQKQLLHLCATADAESDFPARIVAALEAELSRPTAQALPLLNTLCELTCRGLPGSDGGGAHFQQRVVELLQLALDKNVCAGAEGGQAAERILAVVASLTSASANSKLSKPGLRRICAFLLTQQRHVPRLAMLMSRGPRLHEACAGATADTLKADDAGAGSALSLLAAASRQMRYAAVASQPAAAVHGLQFLVEVGRRCPLTLAAGLDCGGVADLLGETIQTLHAKPAATAKKLALEFMGGLLQALPVQLLDQSSLQQAAHALLARAADGAVDATGRAHALQQLGSLLPLRVWPESEPSGFVASTVALLEMLPEAGGRIMTALCQTIVAAFENNPWRLPLDLCSLERSNEGAAEQPPVPVGYEEWLRAVADRFQTLAAALEANGAQPLLDYLHRSASLSTECLSLLVARALEAERWDGSTNAESGRGGAQLHSLLRAQLLDGVGACARDDDGGAWRLSRLVVIQQGGPALCDALLGAIGLSHPQMAGLAPSLRDLACGAGDLRDVPAAEEERIAALELLAAAAKLQPGAVHPAASLGWTQHEAALAIDAGAIAARRVAPLLRLMAALVAARGSTQQVALFLCRHGVRCARMGAVVPTVAAIYEAAHPPAMVRTAMARLLSELSRGSDAGDEADGVLLMGALAEAARHSAAALRRESSIAVTSRSLAPQPGSSAAAVDEYDYMLEEEEKARREEQASSLLLARLRGDDACGAMPMVARVAENAAAGPTLRAAATSALARFAHLHHTFAEEQLPTVLRLTAESEPLAVRCRATLLFASLVPLMPAQAEPHLPSVLHEPLNGEQPVALRHAANLGLTGLVDARLVQSAAQLPHLLPCLQFEELHVRTMQCISRLVQHEGASGWPRLLYASLLQLCPHTPVEAFASLLPHLLPGTLGGARPQELSTCAEALVSQLAEGPPPTARLPPLTSRLPPPVSRLSPPATRLPPPATRRPPLASRHQPPPRATAPTPATACTAAALHHAGGKAAAFCINIAHVFAAWPPSDRSLGATLRALSGTGSISPLLVFCRRRRGAAVRRALVSHVQRARAKQLKGTSLDALARLLELDEAHASDGSDDEAPEDSGENGDGALGVINGETGGDGDGTDGAAAGATGQEQRKGEGGEDGTLARAKAALVKCGAADRT